MSWGWSAPDYNRSCGTARFHSARCSVCDLIFLADPPGNLGPYYENEPAPQAEVTPEQASKMQWERVDLVSRHAAGRRLVELGPGLGGFAYATAVRGFDVTVVDRNPAFLQRLQHVPNIRGVLADDPSSVLEVETSFDVIAMWQSLEHMPAPWALLELAARRLSANGIVVLATPNPDCLGAKLFRGRWYHFDAPRHLTLLSKQWFEFMASRIGLSIVHYSAQDREARFWNKASWRHSLENLVTSSTQKKRMRTLGGMLSRTVGSLERRWLPLDSHTLVLRAARAQ